VKKLWQYVKPFSSDTGTSRTDRRTDRQTELLYQYRASVCKTRDKNITTTRKPLLSLAIEGLSRNIFDSTCSEWTILGHGPTDGHTHMCRTRKQHQRGGSKWAGNSDLMRSTCSIIRDVTWQNNTTMRLNSLKLCTKIRIFNSVISNVLETWQRLLYLPGTFRGLSCHWQIYYFEVSG